MVIQRSLSGNKFSHVSRTLLSILANLNTAVVWMVSACPPISNTPSRLTVPLITVPSAPITVGIIAALMFHSFLSSLIRCKYLSLISLSLIFTLWSAGTTKSTNRQVLLSLLSLLFIRVFNISVSWWYFTGDWVTASLLKSPGLFSVFWPFSIMLLFGWSPLGRQLLNLPGSLIILSLPCQKHQSQLV